MDPDSSDESPLPKEWNPDDVDDEVSNPLCERIGNPDAGGLFLPTLPPFEKDGESVDELVFGKFEVLGEMNVAASRHMVAFCTVFLRWYKSKNYTSTVLTKEHYHRICEFCEQITDGVDCGILVCEGFSRA
jgi:hypothetical protein